MTDRKKDFRPVKVRLIRDVEGEEKAKKVIVPAGKVGYIRPVSRPKASTIYTFQNTQGWYPINARVTVADFEKVEKL